jgi:hypothetical protein
MEMADVRFRTKQSEQKPLSHPIRRLDDVEVDPEPSVLEEARQRGLEVQACLSRLKKGIEPPESEPPPLMDIHLAFTPIRFRLTLVARKDVNFMASAS